MTQMEIEIDGKTYWLKIGPKSIMYLRQFPEYNEEDVFAASIITLHNMSITEAKCLYQQAASFCYTTYQPLFEQVISFLSMDLRDLYRRAVGEIGISPASFFQMSIEEIELAYEGYLRRQELSANMMKAAVLQALSGDKSTISIAPKPEYGLGTIQEYNNTFSRLER